MKRIYLILPLLFCLCKAGAQVIDNRLDLGFGSKVSIPLNASFIRIGDFRYPSLYGNFLPGPAGNAYFDFRLRKQLGVGFSYERTWYTAWDGDADLFILKNPKMLSSGSFLRISWYPVISRKESSFFSICLFGGPLLHYNRLQWTDFEQDVNMYYGLNQEEYYLNPGLGAGAGFLYSLNNNAGVRLDLSYAGYRQKSILYFDRFMSSFNAAVSVYFRFNKDIYYKYD